jgi:acetolactate synthase-1/2/3 large subunit
LIDNGGYNSILQTQVNYFPDNVFGTGHSNGLLFPDFIRLAESFGIRAISVQRPQDLDSDIYKEALASDQPCLVSVKVDSAQQFSPKLASKKLDDGTMVTPRLENMWPFLDEHELLQNTISD